MLSVGSQIPFPCKRAEPIADTSNLSRPSSTLPGHSRLRNLALFTLAALATTAWPQQSPANLPESPQPRTPFQTEAKSPPELTSRGAIRGSVVDRDGAAYQGIRIALNQPSSPEKSTSSDESGRYLFNGVPVGPFEITATSSGFATKRVSGTLHPGESLELPPIVLLVTTATSEVQVTASRMEIAQEQLKEEEHQRVLGIIPNFYVVYEPNALPLTARQKFHLAWRTSIDPVSILSAGAVAGIQQADNDFKEYGQGTRGYAKRFGASYAEDFIGGMMGGAIFPAMFKQDPRYFYKGTGTKRARAFYAIANAVVCKGDNGHTQFNYSGILGSLAAAGITNIYYPASEREGATLTFEEAGLGIGFSAIGNLFQEFFVRKLTPKIPNYTPSKP